MNWIRSLAMVILGGSWTVAALGQASGIQGTVLDASQAIIPGATITISNISTGASSITKTNQAGFYSVPFLPPGFYRVQAFKDGLSTATREGLKVDVNQLARIDFTLKVGPVAETVQVSAASVLLESEMTEVGQVIDNKRIQEMPLNRRNYLDLALLASGALPAVRSGDGAEGGFVAMGQHSRQMNVMVDGADNSTRNSGGPLSTEAQATKPSVDAVGEFKVITNNFSAEYGFRMGPKVIVSLKSGTNTPHGSLFEFLRNDRLDASNFFANRSGSPKPPYRQNQFGGTLGGPIIKNKAFFFGSYEGTRIRIGRSYTSTVPSAAARRGDFSKERVNLNRIFDPLTTTGSGATANRSPFPGNIIPAGRFDSVTSKLADLWPQANIAGREFMANNYFFAPSNSNDSNQLDLKFDFNFSDKDRTLFRYSRRSQERIEPGAMPIEAGGPTVAGARSQTVELTGHNLAAGWTRSITPRLFNEVRFGYTHLPTQFGLIVKEALNGAYGIKNAPGDSFGDRLNQGFSSMALGSYNSLGTPCCWPNINNMENLNLSDNLWLQKGSHTIKAGFEHRRADIFRQASRLRRGEFSFSGVYTSEQPNVGPSRTTTGNPLADFLLGWASSTNAGNLNGENSIMPYWGAYVQDDWKITSRLTLNLGLRYELLLLPRFPGGSGENGVSNYLTIWSPVAATDPRFETFVRPTSDSDTGARTNRKNFSPRLGLAYRASQNTVIRAGGGIFFGEFDNPSIASPWVSQAPQFTEIVKNGTNVDPAVQVRNGFDPIQFPAKTVLPGVSVTTGNFHNPNNYAAEWFLDIQRELPGDVVFTAGYQGSATSHIWTFHDVNNGGPHPSIPAASRRVRPQFNGVNRFFAGGNSNYNALRVNLEKRFSKGLTFLSSYTWSHTIDAQPQRSDEEDRTYADPYNLSRERSNSGQDIRHSYTNSFTYELPMGRGKPFGSGWHRALDAVLGGWQIGGILTLRTGFPFDLSFPGDTQNSGTRNRGDRIGSGTLASPTIDLWFDQNAFVQGAPGIFGNTGRNLLFGPGTKNFDFSLAKRFRLPWEGHQMQFRFESFNFTNTPKFGQPNATLRQASTATINSAGEPRRIQFGLKWIF